MDEEWRDIEGFGGHYQVSSLGRVRVKDRVVSKMYSGKPRNQFYRGRLLTLANEDRWGHKRVTLSDCGVARGKSVHGLVLTAFVGPRPTGMEACHNNGDPTDNRVSNLRWDTHAANNADRKAHGKYPAGESHYMWKWSHEDRKKMMEMRPLDAVRTFGISYTHLRAIKAKGSANAMPSGD